MKKYPIIAHISAYYPPHLGGLERVAEEVSEQLARDGYEIQVLTSTIGAAGKERIEKRPNLLIKRLWGFEFAHTVFIPSLLLQLLRVKKPAIFHLHLAQVYVPEMVWLAAKLRGIPYIIHFHLDVEPSGKMGFLFVWWKRWIQPILIRGAAHVIALSPEQRTLIVERYHKPSSQVSCIGNGVGQTFLEIGKHKRDIHTPLRLLFVGRLSVQKRAERLIEAVSHIDTPVTVSIVGDGEDMDALQELVARKNIPGVTFEGALFEDKLLHAYREADLFVLPSDKEGMPLAILEAMAAGLPIVGSDVLGIRELVEGVGVLVANPNPETFAEAINILVRNPQQVRDCSQRGFARAQEYSWNRLVKQLEVLYQQILS